MSPASKFAPAHVRNLPALAWALFLAATALLFVVTVFEIGEAQAGQWIANPELRAALVLALRALDPTWIMLAAVCVYFFTVQGEGLATARRWACILIAGSGALAWLGARTGVPFGPLVFTSRAGARIADVLPFTIPLLWLVVVVAGRCAVLWLWPRAGRWQLALGTGLLALVTDVNMEFFAWKIRAWWLWYPPSVQAAAWPPPQNFAVWLVAAAVLASLLHEGRMPVGARRRGNPALVLLLMNTLFLAARAAAWLRR
jgi:putative membrane protein